MGMSFLYTAVPQQEEESIATIHRALELGVTHLDTSDVYGPFTNEVLVGMWNAFAAGELNAADSTDAGELDGDGGVFVQCESSLVATPVHWKATSDDSKNTGFPAHTQTYMSCVYEQGTH
jgi:hypothetical protein